MIISSSAVLLATINVSICHCNSTKKEKATYRRLISCKMQKIASHLYDVVVKQQPEAVALDDGDVVSAVWAAAGHRHRDALRNKTAES